MIALVDMAAKRDIMCKLIRNKEVSMRQVKMFLWFVSVAFFAIPAAWVCPPEAWAASVKVRHEHQEGIPDQVKAESVVKASPEAVWSYLIRFNDYSKFMPRVIESLFISEDGIRAIQGAGTRNANKLRSVARKYKIEPSRKMGGKWEGYVFMVLDTPFPVENRWYVLKAVQDETRSREHIYRRCWNLVIGNIESAEGCWTLKPGEETSETLASYEDVVNPGGNVPEWAAKMGANQTVPQMFKSLEKMAQIQ